MSASVESPAESQQEQVDPSVEAHKVASNLAELGHLTVKDAAYDVASDGHVYEILGTEYADRTKTTQLRGGKFAVTKTRTSANTAEKRLDNLWEGRPNRASASSTLKTTAPSKPGIFRKKPDLDALEPGRVSTVESAEEKTTFTETKVGYSTGNTITRVTEVLTGDDGIPIIKTKLKTTNPDGDVVRERDLEYSGKKVRHNQHRNSSLAAIRTSQAVAQRVADAQPKSKFAANR